MQLYRHTSIVLICALASVSALGQDVSKCVDAQRAKARGNPDQAVTLYTACIDEGELTARNRTIALNNRGNVYLDQKRYNFAIADFDAALELDPQYAKSLNNRGLAYQGKALFQFAVRDFEAALSADPNHLNAYNNLAWIRATCPDENVRDGAKAIELAQHVVEATESEDPSSLDTLAAAYAETGDFENAIKLQKEAISMANGPYLDTLISRLLLYRNGKPFRM